MLSPALGALALLALPFVVGDFWSYQLALSFLYAIATARSRYGCITTP